MVPTPPNTHPQLWKSESLLITIFVGAGEAVARDRAETITRVIIRRITQESFANFISNTDTIA